MGFLELVQTFGLPVGGLIFAVMAFYFDWVVSGKRYREVVRQRDQLLRVALGSTRAGERNANVAERAMGIAGALVRQHGESDGNGGLD